MGGKGLDEERVSKWLGGNDGVGGWKVQEELDKRWERINHKGRNQMTLGKDLELAAFSDLKKCNIFMKIVGRSRGVVVR